MTFLIIKVPKTHDGECQHLLFSLQNKPVEVGES